MESSERASFLINEEGARMIHWGKEARRAIYRLALSLPSFPHETAAYLASLYDMKTLLSCLPDARFFS